MSTGKCDPSGASLLKRNPTSQESPMSTGTVTRLLAAAIATAAVSGSGVAVAKNGADDPVGHVRSGHGADDRAGHIRHSHGRDDSSARAVRRATDDPAGHVLRTRGSDDPVGDVSGGHGADDGPGHA
jgi:hypothetical protein